MTQTSREPGGPAPASTVLVLRDRGGVVEVFMVRRHQGTAFMGGAFVFPGGRVDPSDISDADDTWCDGLPGAATNLPDLPNADAVGHHVAAARELFEEAGVLVARDGAGRFVSLADAAAHRRFKRSRHDVHGGVRAFRDVVRQDGLRLALDAFVPWAHWVTPPVDVRQFDTRFFVTRVPPDQVPAHDEAETTESVWTSASAALDRCRRDEIVLPPPTWTTLRELEPFATVEAAIGWARTRTIRRWQPKAVEEGGSRMLLLPGDPLNPEAAAGPPPLETRFVLVNGRWRAGRPRT